MIFANVLLLLGVTHMVAVECEIFWICQGFYSWVSHGRSSKVLDLLSFNFRPAVSSRVGILQPREYLILQFLNRSTVYYLKFGEALRVSAILFFFFFFITSLVALCYDCLWAVLPKQLMTIDSTNHYSLTFSHGLSSHDLSHALFPALSVFFCCFFKTCAVSRTCFWVFGALLTFAGIPWSLYGWVPCTGNICTFVGFRF